MTGEVSAVPHFPRISAADRADGSVEILAQGESHVFSPMPGRGADDARMRALQHLHEVALGLGRPVRVTTWTLDRSRASIVVTPAGDCYDEVRPHSSFVIAPGPTTSSASPAPDIPAAIRPWGLDLRPAPPIPGTGAGVGSRSRRTRWVVAAALAMLLLWSGVVAVLLTTGHQNAAVADPHGGHTPSGAATPTPTPTPSPSPTVPPQEPTATTAVAPPLVAVTPLSPGTIRITVTRTGATGAHPLAMRVRVDPDAGKVFHRLVHLSSAQQSIVVGHLSGGSARWVVLVAGSPMVIGRVDVMAPAPPTPSAPPTTIPPTIQPTIPPTTPADPTPPPTPHHHHVTHHHTTHHHSGGTTHHGPSSNPSNPVDPIPGRVTSRG